MPEGDAYDSFVRAAFEDGKHNYFTVTDKDIISAYNVSKLPALVMFRNFEEPRVSSDEFQ